MEFLVAPLVMEVLEQRLALAELQSPMQEAVVLVALVQALLVLEAVGPEGVGTEAQRGMALMELQTRAVAAAAVILIQESRL
jgi:hypothetical protein